MLLQRLPTARHEGQKKYRFLSGAFMLFIVWRLQSPLTIFSRLQFAIFATRCHPFFLITGPLTKLFQVREETTEIQLKLIEDVA